MKGFFQKYSYSIIKMFVNQFAISLFGLILAMLTTAVDHTVLTIVASAFSIAFYLFLIYTMTWEIGAKDRIAVDYGKMKHRPHTGLLMSLVANIPNFLLAILYTIAYPFMGTHRWAGNMNAILNLISAILEGMYRGLLTVITLPSGRLLLNAWWSYFLIIVPALITSWLAYIAGFKNFRMLAAYFNKREQEKKKQ